MSDLENIDQIYDGNELPVDDIFEESLDNDSDIDDRISAIQDSWNIRPAWRRIEEYFEMRDLRKQLNDPAFHF